MAEIREDCAKDGHDFEEHFDWYGDPVVIGGTKTFTFYKCRRCGHEQDEVPVTENDTKVEAMKYNPESLAFWRDHWAEHTVPTKKLKYPEGEEALSNLQDATYETFGLFTGIRDIGCGYGRLASLYNPHNYIGYDISPGAIKRARKENPYHIFVDWEFQELPKREITLLYVVMLHVDDNDLHDWCALVSANTQRIVIADIMKKYLNFSRPLCVGRDQQDYIAAFEPFGFKKTYSIDSWYPIYHENLTLLILDKI